MSDIILITTCANQKHLEIPESLYFRNTPEDITQSSWDDLIKNTPYPTLKAIDLYKGALWKQVKSIYESPLLDKLYIISAGYGILKPTDEIKPYSIGFRQDSFDAVQTRGYSSQEWWDGLKSNINLKEIIESNPNKKVILYGSNAYMRAISNEVKPLLGSPNLFIVSPDTNSKDFNPFLIKPPLKMRYILGGNTVTVTINCIKYLIENSKDITWDISSINQMFLDLCKDCPDPFFTDRKSKEKKPDDFFINFIPSLPEYTPTMKMAKIRKLINTSGYAMGTSRLYRILEKINHKY